MRLTKFQRLMKYLLQDASSWNKPVIENLLNNNQEKLPKEVREIIYANLPSTGKPPNLYNIFRIPVPKDMLYKDDRWRLKINAYKNNTVVIPWDWDTTINISLILSDPDRKRIFFNALSNLLIKTSETGKPLKTGDVVIDEVIESIVTASNKLQLDILPSSTHTSLT